MIENIKRFIKINNLDGYIIPKNDNYFTEYSKINNLARVTNLGGLNKFYLDLKPYIDATYWEQNYGATLPWYRKPSGDDGIYGWQTQLTVTGPYVNVTMFEDAGVDMPEEGATWDDWADALREVKSELGLTAGLALDRTAHRWRAM